MEKGEGDVEGMAKVLKQIHNVCWRISAKLLHYLLMGARPSDHCVSRIESHVMAMAQVVGIGAEVEIENEVICPVIPHVLRQCSYSRVHVLHVCLA